MAKGRGMNPYVFFVGCPRSGTTLLQRIADAHPALAVTHETRWIPRWYEKRIGIDEDGFITAALVERVLEHPRFRAFKLPPTDVWTAFDATRPQTYAQFVGTLFDHVARSRGKHLAGDKSPDYALHLATLHDLWPEALFVHIIRDGRDVALSMLEWQKGASQFSTWRADPLTTVAVWWDWHVRVARETAAAFETSLYQQLRYEALVANPEQTCRELCRFLALPFSGDMLRFHEGRMPRNGDPHAKQVWRPVTTQLRRWRDQMAVDDVAKFEAAAGDLLEELGYERETSPTRAALAHAAAIRANFAAEAVARDRVVPRAWELIAV
jgi:Sulfotransferase family